MRPPNNKGKRITKVNALTQAKLIKLLLDGTRSCSAQAGAAAGVRRLTQVGKGPQMKPVYSIDAPDQQRLKVARIEIEAVLARHDLAGVVVLHTPGMSEFFYNLQPSYSVCWIVPDASEGRPQ